MALERVDLSYPEPAYQWGRLVAELESIQKAAVPGAKSTLIDRYFGAASTAPATVYSILMRNAQPHLAKLRKERPSVYSAYQHRLEDIQAVIPPEGLSRTFDMKQQGLFALGYYHQRAANRAAIILAKQQGATTKSQTDAPSEEGEDKDDDA